MAQSNVFLYRMPSGIPGSVNREWAHVGEPQTLDVANPPLFYGDPVKIGANGRVQALQAGDTAASVVGFLERPQVSQNYNYGSQGYGAGTPLPGARCTIMVSGYMEVSLQGSTSSTNGGQVFIRVAGTVPAGGHVGGLESVADATAGNTIALPLPGSRFKGAADAGGNTEIGFNL